MKSAARLEASNPVAIKAIGRLLRAVPSNVRTNILEKITKVVTNVRTHDIFASHILTVCVTKQEKNVRTN